MASWLDPGWNRDCARTARWEQHPWRPVRRPKKWVCSAAIPRTSSSVAPGSAGLSEFAFSFYRKSCLCAKKRCVIWRDIWRVRKRRSQITLSLKCVYTLPQYILMAACIPAEHGTNQKSAQHDVEVEPTIHLWIHVVSISTPLGPRKCPRPLPV